MNPTVRHLARRALHKSGGLKLFHYARHRECLTVVMFHRVLPASSPEYSFADPLYTVTPEFLRLAIAFFKGNYNIVGVDDVLCSLARERPLPARPLLITFDDGWRDNLQWAKGELPNIPWTLFVATGATSQSGWWWQELLLWVLRTGKATHRSLLADIGKLDGGDVEDTLGLLIQFADMPSEGRSEAMAKLERRFCPIRVENQMLAWTELEMLREDGVTLGSHGTSHLPLSRLDNPAFDLLMSRRALEPLRAEPVMSFPHGRYNAKALEAARQCGFRALFTSDPVLNPCPGGWLKSDMIGRISLDSGMMTNGERTFAPDRLATNLFLRDVAEPRGNDGL